VKPINVPSGKLTKFSTINHLCFHKPGTKTNIFRT
jgi:hypothetical protein